MKVYYWSPHIDKVATVRSVINSAYSLKLYSKNKYIPFIINVAGEWDDYIDELNQKKKQTIQLTNSKIIKNKSIKGFLEAGIYFYIFFISFIPLLKLLKKNTPEYFIAHLITPLPLIINYFFNIKTKLVLRISGFPKLNILRLFVWNITLKKVSLITCPTLETKNFIYNLNLINKNKLNLLYDPVISSKQIIIKKKQNFNDISINNFFLMIGRLTKQKNFIFLLKIFILFNKDYKNKLVIAGEGEDRPKIEKLIKDSNQQNNIFLIGYKENILVILKNVNVLYYLHYGKIQVL